MHAQASLTKQSSTWITRWALCIGLAAACLSPTAIAQKFYGQEQVDTSLEPRTTMRYEAYHAPTPLSVPGAKTVMTEALYAAVESATPPVLIDVLGGPPHQTIKGAIWWGGAGIGHKAEQGNRDVQTKFTRLMQVATAGDKEKPVVFFCLSHECWLSYNAALRAVAAGYKNVMWYRGGIESWKAAGNSMAQSGDSRW
jgi:PQQ-dependent catabolism-associated CXXCW motif protein